MKIRYRTLPRPDSQKPNFGNQILEFDRNRATPHRPAVADATYGRVDELRLAPRRQGQPLDGIDQRKTGRTFDLDWEGTRQPASTGAFLENGEVAVWLRIARRHQAPCGLRESQCIALRGSRNSMRRQSGFSRKPPPWPSAARTSPPTAGPRREVARRAPVAARVSCGGKKERCRPEKTARPSMTTFAG